MDDIISIVAVDMGKGEWARANYWIYTSGKRATYSVDDFSDGDHETCSKRDLPTPEEEHQSWLDYSQFVLETGTDPLLEFVVKHETVRKERWQFKFSPSLVGPVLFAARHAGRAYLVRELPAHVLAFLNLKTKGAPRLQDFKTSQEFTDAGLKFGRWHTDHVESKTARDPEAIARDLRRLARRRLARG